MIKVEPIHRSMSGCLLSCLGVFSPLFYIVRRLQEAKREREIQKRKIQERKVQERAQEIERQEELARRRRKVEEGLALIGTPGWENHIIGSAAPTDQNTESAQVSESFVVDTDPNLGAKCFCDAPLPPSQSMEVFALPIIHGERGQLQGLLLQPVDCSPVANDYQRIGMFEMDNGQAQLRKFSHISEEERFFMI